MKFDKVRSLDDREQAREKLPVWYGSRSNYYHGFREVAINNPIDEISNNFEKGDIFITLHDDMKTITVRDTGRGMPIHLKDDKGEDIEVILNCSDEDIIINKTCEVIFFFFYDGKVLKQNGFIIIKR